MTTEATQSAHSNPGKVPIGVGKDAQGKWKAAPPSPHVKRGDDVSWNFSACSVWSLSLPADVFDGETNPHGKGSGAFTCTVRTDAPTGSHKYSGNCDGQDIEGNSPPTVIVDP